MHPATDLNLKLTQLRQAVARVGETATDDLKLELFSGTARLHDLARTVSNLERSQASRERRGEVIAAAVSELQAPERIPSNNLTSYYAKSGRILDRIRAAQLHLAGRRFEEAEENFNLGVRIAEQELGIKPEQLGRFKMPESAFSKLRAYLPPLVNHGIYRYQVWRADRDFAQSSRILEAGKSALDLMRVDFPDGRKAFGEVVQEAHRKLGPLHFTTTLFSLLLQQVDDRATLIKFIQNERASGDWN